jgi:predicted glycoside hydrolase/deacetylase ChbG (UPF0249 family)
MTSTRVSVPRLCLALAAVGAATLAASAQDASKPLVERLGFPAGTKVLILNADDFGMNSAGTQATIDHLKAGELTSATIMVPCGWFMKAAKFAKENPQASLGVHTTLTSEWGSYKWGPVLGRTAVPSLVDELGYLFPDVRDVYSHAKLDEVEKEVKAQIDMALKAGVDVTHIDSHMGTLQYDPKYHELYIKIAKDYNLPCRIAGAELMKRFGGEHLIAMADEMGVLHPDYLVYGGPDSPEQTDAHWTKVLQELPAGKVSEIYIHPGADTPEMRDTTGSWRQRTADSAFFRKPETRQLIKDLGIELISYRELRELQRTGKPLPRVEYNGW